MELTKENFNVYAATNYDNPFCLSEDEFKDDLKQLTTIKRMMSKYINNGEANLRLLINNVIIFYNVFDHHAATQMIQLKANQEQIQYFNAVLSFLSFPMLIPPEDINEELLLRLREEFQ